MFPSSPITGCVLAVCVSADDVDGGDDDDDDDDDDFYGRLSRRYLSLSIKLNRVCKKINACAQSIQRIENSTR
jgi:hypothetical protein